MSEINVEIPVLLDDVLRVRVPRELRQRIERLARRRICATSDVAREALAKYVREQEAELAK